jgi:hypothetical protein
MQRRNFLVGIGSASVGGSALLGSGAFSRVEAQRNVSVQVAEDHEAYLGLGKCNTPNGSYAHPDDDGHLELLMNPDNPTMQENGGESPLGSGVNSNSQSWFDRVFQVCNNGKETVCLHIEDDDSWPRVPETDSAEHAGERRVEFYLDDNDNVSLIGEENALQLTVGECICVGVKTRSYGLSDGDELLDALDNEIRIIADVDGDCVDNGCPILSGAYQCTTYEGDADGFSRTGTRFRITNMGPTATNYDLAVADSPSDYRSNLSIGPNTTQSRPADASVPQNAVIAWDAPEGCEADLQTWGEYKADVGVADLTDWYETFGTNVPTNAPEDFDDEFVIEVTGIPEVESNIENTLGPDAQIPADVYPEMSDPAETEGWITCMKEGTDE